MKRSSSIDSPTLLHTLSPQTLLIATDSSFLYLYDLRTDSSVPTSRPQQAHHPHEDYVTSITSLTPTENSTSGFSKQWVSTGGTTVAVTDLRRGILTKSEDQGEELLSSTIVSNKLVVGGEKGGLRFWDVGVWDDNEKTVTVGKGASADILATVPEGVGKEQMLAVGMDDGFVRFVGMGGKRPKVLGAVSHDEVEGVLGLGFEAGGRMCSGGGTTCKIWEEGKGGEELDRDEETETQVGVNGKRGLEDDSENEHGEVDRSSAEEEEQPKKSRKKKKRKSKGKKGGNNVMLLNGID